ncbi:MAG: MoxR family ATPase [Cyclobacteriaceae bacterium]
MDQQLEQLKDEVTELVGKLGRLKKEIHKSIIGQDHVIDQLLIGMLARGHVLVEGLPGLAKTMMIKALSKGVNLNFNRIQFTPDLMPTDILGTEVIEEDEHGKKSFVYNQGPVFTNVLLADEINRTPPKTQAALLEVMQEYKVTYGGKDYPLEQPFFMLATQNPLEQSGTFPLPEAQVDRFLLYVLIDYPTADEELEILRYTTGTKPSSPEGVLTGAEIIRLQSLVREVFIDDELIKGVNNLVRSTRPTSTSEDIIKEYVSYGAGPRAGQAIIMTAKAHALINGRYSVTPADIEAIKLPALRHRLLLNFKAESEHLSTDYIIQELSKNH